MIQEFRTVGSLMKRSLAFDGFCLHPLLLCVAGSLDGHFISVCLFVCLFGFLVMRLFV